MADIGTLLMKVNADTKGFEDGIKRSQKIMGGLKTATKVASGAILAGGAALGVMAKKATDNADRIDKMSQKLGLSRKGFQEMEFIASQTGTSIESLSGGMKTLAIRATEAAEGTGEGAAAFEKLGINVLNANGELKTQEQLLTESITAMQAMEDGTEKAALATDLLGRSGQELIPLLNGAEGSMADMAAQANDLGLVIGDDIVDAGVKMTDTIDQIKRIMGSVVTQIGGEVLPILQEMGQYIVDNMPTIKKVMENVFNGIKIAIGIVVNFVRDVLIPIFMSIKAFWDENSDTIIETVTNVFNSIIATGTVMWEFFRDNILPILQEVIKFVVDNFPLMKEIAVTAFSGVIAILKGMWEILEVTLFPVLKFLFDTFKENFPLIQAIAETSIKIISDVMKGIVGTIQTVIDIVKTAIQAFKDFFEVSSKSRSQATGLKKPSSTEKTVGGQTVRGNRANGGPVTGGSSFLVGEKGPEMFTPSTNGSISSGGNNVTININGTQDPNLIMNQVVRILSQQGITGRA